MKHLSIIVGSVREGRVAERVAQWVTTSAKQLPDTTVQLLDLKDIALPFYDEPLTPDGLKGMYRHPNAQQWYKDIVATDYIVWVTPEYNHSYPAVVKNAVDYIKAEWQHKPTSIVSYSPGPIGGARAAAELRSLLCYLGVDFRGELNLSFVTKLLDAEGQVTDSAVQQRLQGLLSKLIAD